MEKTVLCFGDSNTHGTQAMRHMNDRRRFPRSLRWPGIMAAKLGTDFTVVEEGHPGRTSVYDDPIEGIHKNGLLVLPALLETHRPINLVIVMLGTNDLKARYSLPASDIALGLERVVHEISSSDSGPAGAPPAVLLVSPVPIEETGFLGDMFSGGASKSRALPGFLEAAARRHQAGFLDLVGLASVDSVDGIHLDEVAHRQIGEAIAARVSDLLN